MITLKSGATRPAVSPVITRVARAAIAGGMNSAKSCISVAGTALWRLLAEAIALCISRQPLARVGLVGRQRDDHHRDLVAELALLPLAAHRDRHHRQQRLSRQLVVIDQPAAQRARAHRHHDVVDRQPERVLDGLDVVQRERAEAEAPVGRDRAVEGGARRSQVLALEQPAVAATPGARSRADARESVSTPGTFIIPGTSARLGSVRGSMRTHLQRPRQRPDGAPSQHRDVVRRALGLPLAARRRTSRGSGVLSSRMPRISAPETPSIAAWCIFVSTATYCRPRAPGSRRAPTAGASGRAGARRFATPARRAAAGRRAAQARSRGCGSRGRTRATRSSRGRRASAAPRRAASGTAAADAGATRSRCACPRASDRRSAVVDGS